MNPESVLVTGASSGIGLELARCFAVEGCRLILVARKRHAMQALADELRAAYKTHSEIVPFDLAEPEAAPRLFRHLESNGTRVDVLVNNAGFGAHGLFAELPADRQGEMVQLNVLAATQLARLFLPRMLERKRGGILNVASTAAFQPGPRMAVYFATKAYLLSFSEALHEEVRGSGVLVSALCPGPTATNFGEAAGSRHSPAFRKLSMTAREVAEIGHRGFRDGKAVVIAGIRNRFLASSVRFAPRSLVRKIAGRLNRASYAT